MTWASERKEEFSRLNCLGGRSAIRAMLRTIRNGNPDAAYKHARTAYRHVPALLREDDRAKRAIANLQVKR